MAVVMKSDRIDFRINEEDKQKLEKAAQLNHLSLASYILSTIMKQADLDIQQNEMLKLNDQDSRLIMDLLDSPMEPNQNLVELFEND